MAGAHDESSQKQWWSLVIRDVTEQKALQAQLIQAEKLSAVGQLISGVAHEINNPLGIILGFAQSIKSQMQPTDNAQMGLDFIEKEAVRCKDLVKNLLVFSRSSQSELHERIDLLSTVEEAISLINTQSRVKNIELIKDLKPDLPPVLANKNQIQQIIINLCNNAMDAMSGTRKGALTVRTGTAVINGAKSVTIQIADNGSGIPKEIRSKIFEPFFTTKEVGKGTGLGLSLAHEIVQKHQGVIEVESELNKGSVFTVHLPILTENRERAA
jgi:signal transduction histidine kinase